MHLVRTNLKYRQPTGHEGAAIQDQSLPLPVRGL
jgi:hypothetical protein